jgi:Cyclin, N-terminal domain/Cyclin, C-terminal domain/Protein kinase domain
MIHPNCTNDRSNSKNGRPFRRCRSIDNQQDPQTQYLRGQKRAIAQLSRLKESSLPLDETLPNINSSKENKVSYTSSPSSSYTVNILNTMTEDLFLHMMTFVVSPKNARVDGNTLRSMTMVCKTWEIMTNSVLLWSKANDADKNYRLSAWRDISSCHANSIQTALIGFVKVGLVEELDKGELVYRMRDRATKKEYIMKTRDMTLDCKEQLRELQAAHFIMGNSFMDIKANAPRIALPIGVDIQGKSLLTWYYPTQQTLQKWFDTSMNCVNPILRRIPNILPIPLATLKSWMRDLCTAMATIYDDLNPWTDCRHGFHGNLCPKSILVAENGTSLHLSCPLHMRAGIDRSEKDQLHCRAPDALQTIHLTHFNDLWALGCICAQIARCGVPLFSARSTTCLLRQIHDTIGSSLETKSTFGTFLRTEIPTLDENGIDFIQKLLHPNLHTRMHAKEALEHPFLNDMPYSVHGPFELAERQLYRALAQERLYESPDSTRYRMDDYQWAALTDWLFEMVEVLTSVNRQVVFQTMAYFDRFLSSYGEIPWERHQLAVGACFVLASQVDPNSEAVSARDLTFSADNTFTTDDVEVCCRFVLENLKFGLAVPTIASFTHAYLAKDIADDGSTESMILFISELALQTPLYLTYSPSLIAGCVVALAKHTLGQQPLWPLRLSVQTGYKWHDFGDCLIELSRAIEHVRIFMPQLKMIVRKYRWQVTSLTIPRIVTFGSLVNEEEINVVNG